MTPLSEIKAALFAAFLLAVLFHSVDAALAALVGLLAIETMKAM
jgi:hypothetical protein